jgi:hypothetical protein
VRATAGKGRPLSEATFDGHDRDEHRAHERLLSAIAIAIERFRRLMDLLPSPLRVRSGRLVPLPLLERRLATDPPVVLQAVGVKTTRRDGLGQAPASAAMSSNAASTADSSTHGCSSRMPGVSMSSAPPGNSTS